MKPLIVVSTCARPGTSYLLDTLLALDKAGAMNMKKIVVSDGPLDRNNLPPDWAGWNLVASAMRSGSRASFMRAVKEASALGTSLLRFEDDVLPCKNAVSYMATFEVPSKFSFVSFFDMGSLDPSLSDGLYSASLEGSGFQGIRGSQCLLLPASTVEILSARGNIEPAKRRHREKLEGPNSVDKALGFSLMEDHRMASKQYAIHLPCLVEHIGSISTAHPGININRPRGRWQRVATRFPGRDFDALGLRLPT